jgi:hypothetical protein
VWATRAVDGRNIAAAQMDLLRAEASTRPHLVVDLDRLRISTGSLAQRIRLELTRAVGAERIGGRNVSLFEVPRVPAGEYRITPTGKAPRGWLLIGIGRDQFAIRTEQIASPAQSISVRFPVPVRGIVIRGDEDARQTVSGLLVEPLSVFASANFEFAPARTAVRYGRTTVFFLDDRSFPEPEAFWVGGARASSIAIQPDAARAAVSLLLRNGPQPNQVTTDTGGERWTVDFAPGEEKRVNASMDSVQGAALITLNVKTGFRPSEQNPSSRDNRFLGIWVKVE